MQYKVMNISHDNEQSNGTSLAQAAGNQIYPQICFGISRIQNE